jgi:rubrerythrin
MAAYIDEGELNERKEASQVLRNQITIEGELIGLYEKTINEIANKAIQQMLRVIRQDSQKHITMLQAADDLINGQEVYTQDRKGLADSLKKHLELEKESIEKGDKLLHYKWLQDKKGLKTIIESWRDDEKRHHKFLKELSDKPFIPISSDDFASVFRDEEFFEKRYMSSKAFLGKEERVS